MNRNDWMGILTSLAVHALLLFVFALMTAAQPEPEPLGFVEVELGTFSQGRPVQKAVEDKPVEEPRQPDPKPKQEETRPAPPKEAKPVNLPKQPKVSPDPEKVQTPKTERVSPETKNNPTEAKKTDPKPEAKPVQPTGSGATNGSTGAAEGKEGTATDETKAAPFLIEGLNRDAVFAPLPPYREKVNAVIKFNIVVDPRGQVISAVPVLKANPGLENAVRDVLLQRWRFNPLPPNAPQQNQIGTVTFRFRLE